MDLRGDDRGDGKWPCGTPAAVRRRGTAAHTRARGLPDPRWPVIGAPRLRAGVGGGQDRVAEGQEPT